MKKRKTFMIVLVISLLSISSSICYGLDTDLYVLTNASVPPNVLIILDSSASMDEVSSGELYSSATDYSIYVPLTGTVYPINQVYIKSTGNNWVETTIPVDCSALQSLLDQYGEAINFSGCGYKNKDFQIGNFKNYLQAAGGPGGSRPRFGLATGIIHSYINTTSGVRFAVMAFNRDKDGNTVRNNNGIEYVFNDYQDDSLDAIGGRLLGFVDENKNGKTEIFNQLATLKNDSWSPLAETLYEAGVYFQGQTSALTGTPYASPIRNNWYCQRNYILVISDGVPTKDNDSRLNGLIQDLNSDGKVNLNEVAKYLYGLDLSEPHKQNIRTYTIGFSMTQPLLEATAGDGGGKYFYVWSSQSFDIAFQSFIAEVLEESVSYVAPVVPISQMERTSAGNWMYLAMFKPTERSFWRGNIKKYCIAAIQMDTTSPNYGKIVDCEDRVVDPDVKLGDILDSNGELVMDSENQIKTTAKSYWSSGVDRDYADAGGVGEKLLQKTTPRKIYTYMGTNVRLNDASNAFDTSIIAPEMLGLASGDTTGRDSLVKFIQGYDAYYENEINPKGPSNKKDWILGAFIHSRPVVVHYGDRSVIYAGANDGMLHAFDNATGEELWGFIPYNLLSKLKNLRGEMIEFYVDGAPKAYLQRDSTGTLTNATLIFGQRRGGNRYIALNIKDPEVPEFLWEIGPSSIKYLTTNTYTTVYQEMGQSWSTPQIGKIKYEGKWVAFIGGGYDETNQDLLVPGNDVKGRGIYLVDITNGNLIWSYTNSRDSTMKYCIPSDITRVDMNGDREIDRLYVGDVGGQVWRFDLGDSDMTGKIVFDSSWSESVKRKIFYPPDVTFESDYDMLFFGTGDREHPKETNQFNRLYAIKAKNSSLLKEDNLYDATLDLIQVGDFEVESAKLYASEGWYIKLNEEGHAGEKCLSNSVLFYGVVYYTTFQPTFGPSGDVCSLSEGIARLYAVDYKTGNAVFNLDDPETMESLTRSDRSTIMGSSIPSGVIITIIGGTTVAYGGVGGGVFRPPLISTRTIIPINWRIVF